MYRTLLVNLGVLAGKLVPAGMPLPILRGPLAGSRWIAGAAAGEAAGMSILFNLCEPSQLRKARDVVERDSVCFDIGANVGLYTLLFARCARHVVAFEPLLRNLSFLYRTIQINRLANVTVVPLAVSDSTGLARFHAGPNCAMGALNSDGEVPVATVSCDDYIDRYNIMPDVIKIDVEGSELSVLRGAAKALSTHKPVILLSSHGDLMRRACLEYVQSLGYIDIQPLDNADLSAAAEFVIQSGAEHAPK